MDIFGAGYLPRVTLMPAPSIVGAAVALLCLWDARFRQRRALAAMDAARRDDLGLSPHAIASELAKPVWRV